MAMSKDREPGSRVSAVLARLGRRARKARWQLAAGVAAVVIVLIAGHAPVWAGVAALLLVMLAALAGPPRPTPHTADTEAFGEAQLQALAAAELADAMPDPVITFDSQGVVAHANKSAQTAFGSIVGGMILQLRFRAPEMQDLSEYGSRTDGEQRLDYAERVPIERVFRVSAPRRTRQPRAVCARVSRIRARRAASTACAPISSPTPATSCARRWPRSPALSRRCAAPPATTRRRARASCRSCRSQTGRMARLIDDLLSLSRLEMKPFLPPGKRGRHPRDASIA